MMVERIEILFDGGGVYKTGDKVTGVVLIKFGKETTARGIFLNFKGKGKTIWRHYEMKLSYHDKEEYFNTDIWLEGGGDSSVTFPPGERRYRFEFQLPEAIPSSFECKGGHVRYTCTATFQPLSSLGIGGTRMFSVNRDLNLNNYPSILMPLRETVSRDIQYFCSTGTLELGLTVNQSGYVPGETVDTDIQITNNTKGDVKLVRLALVQRAKLTGLPYRIGTDWLYSKQPSYELKEKKFIMLEEEVMLAKGRSGRLQRSLIVPPVPPSKLDGCTLIDVIYFFRLNIKCDGQDIQLKEIPTLIGSVPYRKSGAVKGGAVPGASAADQGLPSYDDVCPPPSYAECVFGRAHLEEGDSDNEAAGGDSNWTPMYTFYDWSKRTGARANQMVTEDVQEELSPITEMTQL